MTENFCGFDPIAGPGKWTEKITYSKGVQIPWSVEPGGHFAGISHEDTVAQMVAGFAEIEAFSLVRFPRVKWRTGRLKYEFRDNEGMVNWIGGKKYYALGIAFPGGRIALNNERVFNTRPESRVIGHLTRHEAAHQPEFMNWRRHSNNPRSMVSSVWTWPHYASRDGVRQIQAKYGAASRWYPVSRAIIGAKLNSERMTFDSLTEERAQLLAERDASTDKDFRAAKQKEVLANVQHIRGSISKMNPLANEWRADNEYWIGATGAVTF